MLKVDFLDPKSDRFDTATPTVSFFWQIRDGSNLSAALKDPMRPLRHGTVTLQPVPTLINSLARLYWRHDRSWVRLDTRVILNLTAPDNRTLGQFKIANQFYFTMGRFRTIRLVQSFIRHHNYRLVRFSELEVDFLDLKSDRMRFESTILYENNQVDFPKKNRTTEGRFKKAKSRNQHTIQPVSGGFWCIGT